MKRIFLILALCLYSQGRFPELSAQTSSDASATGISRAFNPAISVNALFGGMSSDRETPLSGAYGLSPGLHLQAADVEITSNVDIYLQSKFVFGGSESESIGIEEAYLTSLRMPIPIMVRGGKMLSSFGRYNLFHLHHMAFAENPLILDYVFQPKLNEVGLEISYLLPVAWYSDLLAGLLNGSNEALFDSPDQNDFGYLAHFDNFWELSDETSLRLGASYLTGARGLQNTIDTTIQEISSRVWGLDLHLKWKPLQYGRYSSFVFEGEYVHTTLNIDGSITGPLHGCYFQALYQFDLRWWLQARCEWISRAPALYPYFPGPTASSSDPGGDLSGRRLSGALAYVPTEFSAYRLQYNFQQFNGISEQQLILQVNVTIGSHPAHKY